MQHDRFHHLILFFSSPDIHATREIMKNILVVDEASLAIRLPVTLPFLGSFARTLSIVSIVVMDACFDIFMVFFLRQLQLKRQEGKNKNNRERRYHSK